jgi:hypothetical protein
VFDEDAEVALDLVDFDVPGLPSGDAEAFAVIGGNGVHGNGLRIVEGQVTFAEQIAGCNGHLAVVDLGKACFIPRLEMGNLRYEEERMVKWLRQATLAESGFERATR